jgi:hypothetical protein
LTTNAYRADAEDYAWASVIIFVIKNLYVPIPEFEGETLIAADPDRPAPPQLSFCPHWSLGISNNFADPGVVEVELVSDVLHRVCAAGVGGGDGAIPISLFAGIVPNRFRSRPRPGLRDLALDR